MRVKFATCILIVMAALAGCSFTIPTNTGTSPQGAYNPNVAQATVAPQLTALAATASAQEGSLRQWATGAEAALPETRPEYAAAQATGAPDFYPQCTSDGVASGFGWLRDHLDNSKLTLTYDTPVAPTAIHVYEIAPVVGAIVRIDVVDTAGNPIVVYEGAPLEDHMCGRIFSVGITSVNQQVDRVVLHFDNIVAPVWIVRYVEIDAVELVGNP